MWLIDKVAALLPEAERRKRAKTIVHLCNEKLRRMIDELGLEVTEPLYASAVLAALRERYKDGDYLALLECAYACQHLRCRFPAWAMDGLADRFLFYWNKPNRTLDETFGFSRRGGRHADPRRRYVQRLEQLTVHAAVRVARIAGYRGDGALGFGQQLLEKRNPDLFKFLHPKGMAFETFRRIYYGKKPKSWEELFIRDLAYSLVDLATTDSAERERFKSQIDTDSFHSKRSKKS